MFSCIWGDNIPDRMTRAQGCRRVICWTGIILLCSLFFGCLPSASSEADYSSDPDYYDEVSGSSATPFDGSATSSSGSAASSGSSSGNASGSASSDWGDDEDEDEDDEYASSELCSGKIDTNSSEVINSSRRGSDSGCEVYSQSSCKIHNYVTLKTENIGYVGAKASIVAHLNPNATEGYETLYYKLCYSRLTSDDSSDVIRCMSNGTAMFSKYTWPKQGKVYLTVHMFRSPSFNESDFLDCATTMVLVADDYGVSLNVKLYSEPSLGTSVPLLPTEATYRSTKDNNTEETFIVGNMTLLPEANLTSEYRKHVKYYYHYHVRGPQYVHNVWSEEPNVTLELTGTGQYSFTVDAIAYLNTVEAHHGNYSSYFYLLEAVSSTLLQVGNNNSVRVGSEEELVASAEGSTPITFCWSQQQFQTKSSEEEPPESSDYPHPHLPPHHHPGPPPRPPKPSHRGIKHRRLPGLYDETCTVFNDSNSTVFREKQTFSVVGTVVFVGRFFNLASEVRTNLTISVVPGPSPVVVASSATAVVVGVTLAALVIVSIILFTAVYIPYKKYKNRMTETADFRFVDLSETSNYWQRLREKSHQVVDYFKRRRHREKIGLVNLGSLPPDDERRRLFYGTNTLTQFAPYETL